MFALAAKSTLAETLVETPVLHLMGHGHRAVSSKSTNGETNMGISIVDTARAPSGVEPISARSWVAILARLARRQIVQIRERRRMRRDAEALLAMDDRSLADIGLRRCEVEFATRDGRRTARADR